MSRVEKKIHTFSNSRAILHDENRYPNAEAFDPRRFLTADGLLNTDTPDTTETFGYSRRICPGRYFAMDMLWLTAANILAVFTIEKPVDENGQIIEPNGEFTSGMIRYDLLSTSLSATEH